MARAGKVKGQTPKVETQEKKKQVTGILCVYMSDFLCPCVPCSDILVQDAPTSALFIIVDMLPPKNKQDEEGAQAPTQTKTRTLSK